MALKIDLEQLRDFTAEENTLIDGPSRGLSAETLALRENLTRQRFHSERIKSNLHQATSWVSEFIGDRFVELAKAPKDTEAIRQLEAWTKSNSWALVLAGGVGAGKTVAMAHLAFASIANEQARPRFLNATRLPFEPVFGHEAGQFVDRLSFGSLLLLDDLGAETISAPIVSVIAAVVDFRYRHLSKTVITTNLPLKEFAERYGQRVADRILDGGTWIELSDASMRGAK